MAVNDFLRNALSKREYINLSALQDRQEVSATAQTRVIIRMKLYSLGTYSLGEKKKKKRKKGSKTQKSQLRMKLHNEFFWWVEKAVKIPLNAI